ncbi:MAG: hypothetical protein JNG89_11435, partial [Planctomycetaceae bacterium]|nr:hypothetical protein [Planctomycetaceae bacterium]
LCLLAGGGLGLYETRAAAESRVFRRYVPDDEQRLPIATLELDGLIGSGEQLLQSRSDDAELHAAVARLHYYRFRLQAAETLDLVAPQRWSEATRWERTSPQAMFGTLARYAQIGDATALARFQAAPAVVEDLQPMSEHIRAARRACPILPFCGLFEALADQLDGGDPSLPLRREAALSPARTRLLHSLALSAEMIRDDELFAAALARCIALDPARTLDYVATARKRLSEPVIVEQLLSASPGPLLDFAETALSPAGRAKAIERAFVITSNPAIPEAERIYALGRLTLLAGDFGLAATQLAAAVAAAPEDPERRWHYARALHSDGQVAEARRQLQSARQLAPRNRSLNSRIDELERTLENEELNSDQR